ncbi:MAG: transposase [Lachnospiraceae bacterium]|nr:transposase [Lachnospiraceae bacterium]
MKFIAIKTNDGDSKGDISSFCRTLHVSRQEYLANKDRPWKYQPLADAMKEILEEEECNDTYGRIRP